MINTTYERIRNSSVGRLGEYFGYPECCIREFCMLYVEGKRPEEFRKLAGNKTGFIPCSKHAKMVNRGLITLRELITNRECPSMFPKSATVLTPKEASTWSIHSLANNKQFTT